MTDCGKIVEMLSAYYDGELSEAEAELVRGHLDTCESCTALLRFFGDVTGAMSDAEPPPELRERVMNSVLEAAPRRAVNTRLYVLRRLAPVAACLAVALLSLTLIKSLGGTKSDSTSTSGGVSMESAMPEAPQDAGSGYAYSGPINEEDESAYDMAGEADIAPFVAAIPPEIPDASRDANEGAETPPTATPETEMTPEPMEAADAPGAVNEKGAETSETARHELEDYYAVFKLPGTVPPILDGYERVQAGENNWRIYIPRAVADTLIGEGYDYVIYNADATEAVVIVPSDG